MFGILQRYVMGEVLRAFTLALITLTTVIVLFMVMIEASKIGLGPVEIAKLVPYVIPTSLPYTIPVSLLFSVTVVYGRLAADNEIVAVKTAGVSAFAVLLPSITLGFFLSVLMVYLSYSPIPKANHHAKMIMFQNLEELFYRCLKKDREFNNNQWPFHITVKDVEDKTLIDATFKHRAAGSRDPNNFDSVIQAKKAVIHFDTQRKLARIYLDGSHVSDPRNDVFLINDSTIEMDIPGDRSLTAEKRIQEKTTPELVADQHDFRKKMAKERKIQAMGAALWMGMGRLNRVDWPQIHRSFVDYGTWDMNWKQFETEKQQRVAMACGPLFFVLLGAPVGVLFARRDFLSAFISCFVPIIILYYPLILLGTNMGKEGILNPTVALWLGNFLLAILSGFVWPSVIRH
ncbi:LptF/LptG family permease [Singulisphaera sp. PoT]|uniref:LptF/LptG family permease n=1 Tax=Singulisphaera sp. PoT TaxID=3411797 RepID=UPI003BF47EC3